MAKKIQTRPGRRVVLLDDVAEGEAGAIVSVTHARADQLIREAKARAATLEDFQQAG